MSHWRTAALLLALILVPAASAQNCCMPRVEEDDGGTAKLVSGIQSATVLLMVVPTVLVAAIGFRVYRVQRGTRDRGHRQ